MKISIGRRKFNITNKDVVMDNGACYQLITQTYYKDWGNYYPVMSKRMFNKFVKDGTLILESEKDNGILGNGNRFILKYYRFNVGE